MLFALAAAAHALGADGPITRCDESVSKLLSHVLDESDAIIIIITDRVISDIFVIS